jgi:hypothetical protein
MRNPQRNSLLSSCLCTAACTHLHTATALLTCYHMHTINTTATLLQVHTFYEAVACMLSDRGTTVSIDRAALLQQLMAMPNAAWREIFARATKQPDSILQPEVVKEVCTVYNSIYYRFIQYSVCMLAQCLHASHTALHNVVQSSNAMECTHTAVHGGDTLQHLMLLRTSARMLFGIACQQCTTTYTIA